MFGEDYDLLGYIAESYYYMSDYEEAIHIYESALKLKPDSDQLFSYISDAYSYLGDYENATKYADKALSINRNNETAINIKNLLKNRKRPIEVQIDEFIKTYYLYYNTENSLSQALQKNNMSNKDISNAL